MPILPTSMSVPETFVCIYLSIYYIYVYIYIYRERERERYQVRVVLMLPSINGAHGLSSPIRTSHRRSVCPLYPQKVPPVLPKPLLVHHCPSPSSISSIVNQPSLSQCSLPLMLRLKRSTRLLGVVFHR